MRDRKQLERYLAVVAQLKAQIAEIDAFELTVEDPRPSPQPERRRRRVESRSQRITAADGARVPTHRSAQGDPHSNRRPVGAATTAAAAAQARAASTDAATAPAPSAAAPCVSGGGSIGGDRFGGPRLSGAPAAASARDLAPAGAIRSSLDSLGVVSHAADELAWDVHRLEIGGCAATRSAAAATSVAISDAAAAAAHGAAGSSGNGTTGFREQGLQRLQSLEREPSREGPSRVSLSSRRDSAGTATAAPGSRGATRPPSMSSVLPPGGVAVGGSATPVPGPSGAAREPLRTGSRTSGLRPLSLGGSAAIEHPVAASPSVETWRQSGLRARPSMPRPSVEGRATPGAPGPSADSEQDLQQHEMEEGQLGLQQDGAEMGEQEDGQEQVELQEPPQQQQEEEDVADGEEWQDGEGHQSDHQQRQQDGAREVGQDEVAAAAAEEEEEGELAVCSPAECPGLPVRSASQQEAAVAATAEEEDEREVEAQAGYARSSLQSRRSSGMRSDSWRGADAAAAAAVEATATAVEAAWMTSQEPAISGLVASSSAAAEDNGPPAAEAAQVEAPAAGARRSSAATTLTPLQLLVQCCGQKPSLELDELPTMDDIIDMLLATAAATGGGGGPGQDGAAGAAGRGRGRGRKAGAARGPSTKRPPLIKVGEGSYGEAWQLGGGPGGGQGGGGGGGSMVIKVVPIEGDMVFNGGPQVSGKADRLAPRQQAHSNVRMSVAAPAVARALSSPPLFLPIPPCHQKTAGDMMSETVMSRELSALGLAAEELLSGEGGGGAAPANWSAGFVHMHAVAVCRGPYSKDLVKAWEKWDKQHGSENEPVSDLPPDQLYWVIAMEDGGADLEKYVLASWDQLRSVLLQTAVSLAVAEASLSFEHRDLHWGNVLVRPAVERQDCREDGSLAARLQGRNLRVSSCGVAATIIDFTASRLQAPDGTLVFTDLSRDPEVFEGTQGEVQFDTYRWMRSLVDNDWSSQCPATNCLWLSYLAEVLSKRFASSGAGKGVRLSAAHKRQLRGFRERALAYGSCGELVWDELFEGLLGADD
ncbi:hypothetical protein PLESTF_001813900 [Pleodorina starrii]|nr:hypothetical protein PLESTF_001813900 [Pleodorina starrii]